MTSTQFAALLGFGFAAAWTGIGFGAALLCLLAAAAFAAAVGLRTGTLDLTEFQERIRA